MLCLEEIHFKYKNVYRLKINEWREIHHINTNQKNWEQLYYFQAEEISEQGKLSEIIEGII